MSSAPTPEPPPARRTATTSDSEAERRRRRERVFGEVLPETTRDERGEEEPGASSPSTSTEEWLRSQVPPHHG